MRTSKIELIVDGVSYACYRSAPPSSADAASRLHYVIAGCGSVSLSPTGDVMDVAAVGPHAADVLRKLAPILAARVRAS